MTLPRSRHLALVVAALCIAGCARNTPPAPTAAEPAAAATATPAPAAAPAPDTVATLKTYQWQLKKATDSAGQSIAALFPATDKPLGLEFGDSEINVTGGCNRMSASYRPLDPTRIEVRPGPSTLMGCPPEMASADAAIAAFLSGTLQVAVEASSGVPLLRLAAADGSALLFQGTPTPAARFGGPGTQMFLEVSTEPCVTPAAASPPCLMVRDRHFDEQGLPSGTPGDWRALPEGIEGYTPVAGEQQVVRVKRYEQAGSAGGKPTEHFVLDLVVESRTVQ
jgi:heat shock protein HslJ